MAIRLDPSFFKLTCGFVSLAKCQNIFLPHHDQNPGSAADSGNDDLVEVTN